MVLSNASGRTFGREIRLSFASPRAVSNKTSIFSSQAAVVRGAAIRGLEGVMPATLICRRHYGLCYGRPFNPSRDDEKHSYYTWGEKYCAGHMDWMLAKVRQQISSVYCF